jgi:hypothetical protein
MIIRSLCRGEPRNTSAPKRAISKREALIDIISMAQQARPKVMGQMEFLRAQLTASGLPVREMDTGHAARVERCGSGNPVTGTELPAQGRAQVS